MERRIITVYCLIDEYLKLLGIKDDVRSSVSNAEILLIGYIAVSDFAGNYRKTHTYFQMIGCCKMVEYSRFIRRLNEMERIIEKLFMWLGDVFIKLEGSQYTSLDYAKRCELFS